MSALQDLYQLVENSYSSRLLTSETRNLNLRELKTSPIGVTAENKKLVCVQLNALSMWGYCASTRKSARTSKSCFRPLTSVITG